MSPTPCTHTHLRTLFLGGIMGLIMSFGLTPSVSLATDGWVIEMTRWDDTKGVVPSTATINWGETIRILYHVSSTPSNLSNQPLACVISDSSGYSEIIRATSGYEFVVELTKKAFYYTPTQNTIYEFRCGYVSNDLSTYTSASPVVNITVVGGGNFSCTGQMPHGDNVEVYPNDTDNLTGSVAWTYSETDTNQKCEFRCKSGYVYNPGGLNSVCQDSNGTPSSPNIPIDIDANPDEIEPGNTTEISWEAPGAVSCQMKADYDPNWSDWQDVPVNGSIEGWPEGWPTQTGYYNLRCLDSSGAGTETGSHPDAQIKGALVRVGYFTTIVKFFASPAPPQQIYPGQSVTLVWEFKHEAFFGCTLWDNRNMSGEPLASPSTASGTQKGSLVVSPQVSTEYILFCQDPTKSRGSGPKRGVTVLVEGNNTPPPPLPPGSPSPGSPPTDNSKCDKGTPKSSCNDATEEVVGRTKDGTGVCCLARTGSEAVLYTIPISNPLAFNTVDEILTSLLGFLQAIIVILSLIMIVIGSIVYMTAGGNDSKLSTGKLIITAALIGLALALAAPSFLKEIGAILGWGAVDGSPADSAKSITEILTGILNFLLSVIGIIGIIMMVVGGLMYLTAAGDEDRINTGKSIVKYSLIGITVALAALVIISQVAKFFG
jgi:hypothetical protein